MAVSGSELDAIVEAVSRAGLGYYEVIPPSEGVDRWDVVFTSLAGLQATGIAMDGRSSHQNLLTDIARVGATRRAAKADMPRLQAIFARWREEDQRKRR